MGDTLTIVQDGTGVTRKMGCLRPIPEKTRRFKALRAVVPDLPRASWQEVDFTSLLGDVWDQGNYGSCTGHGCGKAIEVALRIMGVTIPSGGLSPTSLYSLVNGGRDDGAIVSDCLIALINTGIGLMAQVPESQIFERQISSIAKANYSRFRAISAYHCNSFDAMVTALQLGYPVAFGISLVNAFMGTIPASGIVPFKGMYVGGHCMFAYGCTEINNIWYLKVQNSWGSDWANGGRCLMGEEHFQGDDLDAFCIQTTALDPQDPIVLPTLNLASAN